MKAPVSRGRLPKRLILLWLLICTLGLFGVTFSQFVLAGGQNPSAHAASFIFRTKKAASSEVAITELDQFIKKPGDEATYRVEITNKQGSAIAEAAQHYEIKAALDGSMPLTCTIQNTGGGTPTVVSKLTVSTASGTASGNLAAGTAQTDVYDLLIQWPEDYNDVKYANGNAVAKLTLTFTSQQID